MCAAFTADREAPTAVVFIGAVAAVVVPVTQPRLRDASVVVTGEVAGGAGGGETGGAVDLVGAVAAVIGAVAAPPRLDAVLVGAGEGSRRAGRSWTFGGMNELALVR